jgi:hypothetical protein
VFDRSLSVTGAFDVDNVAACVAVPLAARVAVKQFPVGKLDYVMATVSSGYQTSVCFLFGISLRHGVSVYAAQAPLSEPLII